MMGTRATPVQQADMLAVISEWMELMKGAGKTLPAAVAQHKTAKEEAEAALARVDASRGELARERTDQQKQAAELEGRERQVVADEAAMAVDRETLREKSEAFARGETENDRMRAELNDQLASIDAQRASAEADIRHARAEMNAEIEAAFAELEREKHEAHDAIDRARSRSVDEFNRLRETVEAELRARGATVSRREEAVAARETATREHAAALAALAQE